ncbi:unnamed protein product [Closterium sp. Naga37s-1]|nr:unnamed protein product [Closterium sp. Naga37s-1]
MLTRTLRLPIPRAPLPPPLGADRFAPARAEARSAEGSDGGRKKGGRDGGSGEIAAPSLSNQRTTRANGGENGGGGKSRSGRRESGKSAAEEAESAAGSSGAVTDSMRRNAQATADALRSKSRRAKRWLGQHYLLRDDISVATVAAAGVVAGDVVVEVGPGTGALTAALVAAGAHVIAVEKGAHSTPSSFHSFIIPLLHHSTPSSLRCSSPPVPPRLILSPSSTACVLPSIVHLPAHRSSPSHRCPDPDMVQLVRERFAQCPQVEVVQADILKWPVHALLPARLHRLTGMAGAEGRVAQGEGALASGGAEARTSGMDGMVGEPPVPLAAARPAAAPVAGTAASRGSEGTGGSSAVRAKVVTNLPFNITTAFPFNAPPYVPLARAPLSRAPLSRAPLARAPLAQVVTNLPFNITTDFLRLFLPLGHLVSTVVCMLQDDAAQRLVDATPAASQYRPMSVFVQYYAGEHSALPEQAAPCHCFLISYSAPFILNSVPISHFPLPISHFPLPISHFPLPISHFPLPISHSSLPISHSPLPTSHSPLPISHSPLPTSHSPLPTSHSSLPISHSPLPISHSPLAPSLTLPHRCITGPHQTPPISSSSVAAASYRPPMLMQQSCHSPSSRQWNESTWRRPPSSSTW